MESDLESSIYLIQGFFRQDKLSLGLGIAPITGVMAIVNSISTHQLFAGMIWFKNDILGGSWVGDLVDKFGPSEMHDIELSPDRLSFTKIYENSELSPIYYSFEKIGDIWKGLYQLQTGYVLSGSITGTANCLLTPAPISLFE